MEIQTVETRDMPMEVNIKASLGISDRVARRIVNVEIMKKIGDLMVAGVPKLYMKENRLYWRLPFLVVPPDGDPNTYPTGEYALVDAHSGIYVLEEQDVVHLKAVSRPILTRLYPDLETYLQKAQEREST